MEDITGNLDNNIADFLKDIIPGLEGHETLTALIGTLIATLIALVLILLIKRSFRSMEKRMSTFR